MRLLFALLFSLFTLPAFAWSSTTCPGGTYDMLGWVTPTPSPGSYPGTSPNWVTPPNHETNLPGAPGYPGSLWTQIDPWGGHIFQVKQSVGYPWDIMKFDANYIYYFQTGNSYSDVTNVSFFNPAVPAFKRCAKAGFPGDTITTNVTYLYSTYGGGNCGLKPVYASGKIIMSLWGPYSYQLGGQPVASPTLVLSYQYGPLVGGVPTYKEEEFYQEGLGWVWWKYSTWNGSSYVLTQQTDLSANAAGSTPAYVNTCGY